VLVGSDLRNEVVRLAQSEGRSESNMCRILIEDALALRKEREKKNGRR
jgi:hypothetical protein